MSYPKLKVRSRRLDAHKVPLRNKAANRSDAAKRGRGLVPSGPTPGTETARRLAYHQADLFADRQVGNGADRKL
jgi:hypothetical protein